MTHTSGGPGSSSGGAQQHADKIKQIRVQVRDSQAAAGYCNAFQAHTSAQELVLDLGMNLWLSHGDSTQQADQDQPTTEGRVLFDVRHRVAMSYSTAKRLAALLAQVVQRHEEQFGPLNPPARKQDGISRA